MHKARRGVLVCCINSFLQGNAVTVTSIRRGIGSNTIDKHAIRRADRMCSNNNSLNENDGMYSAIRGLFCARTFRLIILSDWLDLD